tara:strand:+ start:49 stop:297 length:249 start_codon:yes stop_codon:yes gene_type:complete
MNITKEALKQIIKEELQTGLADRMSDQPAEGYLAKIKAGEKDVWAGLRNAMEGDMSGVGDIMTKEEAGALVLQIADLLVDEA